MARIYVGNLPMNIKEREIEDIFRKFGRIRDIEIKTPSRPPAYAFVSFDDSRDAEDAVDARDGYKFDGERIRVEFSKGRGEARDRGDDRGRGRERSPDRSRKPSGRRTPFRITVSGLPEKTSWQDLKDFMRAGGDIVFADVDRRGGGVVEYSNRSDMLNAVKKCDDTEFKMSYGSAIVRCRADDSSSDRGRSGSRSVSRSRSRSRDRKRGSGGRSKSRSRSRSRSRSSRSSRSRSRSPEKSKRSGDHKKSPSASRSRSPSPKDSKKSVKRSPSRSKSRSHSRSRSGSR